MENCPEEVEEDAQVGILRITTNTSYRILLLHAKLAISPALWGHQAHKPQAAAEIRSSPAHLG